MSTPRARRAPVPPAPPPPGPADPPSTDAVSTPAAASAPPEPPSPARRRLFVGITLAFPWVLLALLELGLRLSGYGGMPPLFVPYAAQPGWMLTNADFARRYFRGSFVPTPHVDFFRADKAPNTFRVFFQGESSAAGFPYGHGAAPSRILQRRLENALPGRPVEVVNTAFTAINSYALLDQADDIIAAHPDAVLVYAGHNEYYGALGAASTRSLGGSRTVVRAYLAARRLRTVQLLDALVGRVLGGSGPRAADGTDAPRSVMQLMAGDQHVPLGSRLYTRGLDQFRGNLRALLARYRAAGVPVFVGTVVSNERDQPPLLSIVARPGDTSAVRHFVLGSAAADHGRVNEARAHLRAAKERDALRFRAPEAINQIIREEAARAGATVVESQQAIERASPLGIPGRTLILEHLHPNVAGYAIIADAFYDALRTRGLPARTAVAAPTAAPAAPPGATPPDLPVTAVDSLAGIYRVGRLTAQWPFQPRGTSVVAVVDTLRPRTPAEQLAQALVRGELPWAAATDQLRQAYERAGDADAAIRVALVMAQEFPYTPQPYMDASRIALAHGRYADGLAFARHALARRETPEAAQLVGLLALRLGDRTGALAFLDRAAELAPGDQRMTVPRDAARALPDLEAARAATPRDTLLLYDLAAAYALTHLYDRARTTLAELQRLAPAHAGARDLLRRLPPP